MKQIRYLAALLVLCFILPACDTLADRNSPLSILGTQALSIGLTQVTGRNVSAADLDGAAALIRSLAGTKKAPATVEIKAAVVSGTDSPSTASKLASGLANAITWAMSKGVKPDTALETAAKQLNQAADTQRP